MSNLTKLAHPPIHGKSGVGGAVSMVVHLIFSSCSSINFIVYELVDIKITFLSLFENFNYFP